MTNNEVTLYTDGSCLGNPGPGGWAAILVAQGKGGPHVRELHDSHTNTTNNRMELTAAIEGLKALKRPCRVTIVTDSQYLISAIEGGKMKANPELVAELRNLTRTHQVEVRWIRGHGTAAAGLDEAYNGRADKLARRAAEQAKAQVSP